MKQILSILFLCIVATAAQAQEVLRLQNGSSVTVQQGAVLTLQGGIALENGSLLINNGTTRLVNNLTANQSNWTDYSIAGALGGTGLVIFNSDHLQQYFGSTHFYNVQMNGAGLTLNHYFTIDHSLHLIKGNINTNAYYAYLTNGNSTALVNDASNAAYANSWLNGNFRRAVAVNTNKYDFPVGNSVRPNLLQFINNNLAGPASLTASFVPKPGSDAGLNVIENGSVYTSVNDGGVWHLTPDRAPANGNYALQLYFNGFTGLADNQFGILRRPDESSNAADWMVPAGSVIEPFNSLGRKVSDGFARRSRLSDFSQFGIGNFSTVPCNNCAVVCTYTQGFYGNEKGKACSNFNGSTSSISAEQLMLNAFGASASQGFGSVANRQFFTLYKTDITNGNIFKMLPGSGNSLPIAEDKISPYDGAYYSNQSTWYLVPIPKSGSQKGRINNQLLSQTISLWFNLRTSSSLATVDLTNDTLVTTAQTVCGSGIPTGASSNFGLPHNVVTYLNEANGYANNVAGLFQLANDALGGVNRDLAPLDVQTAIATINNAFDGCRILTATLPYLPPVDLLTKTLKLQTDGKTQTQKRLLVAAFPNPYRRQFSLQINSPVSGLARIEFFASNAQKIFEIKRMLTDKLPNTVPYTGPYYNGTLMYKVTIDQYAASGFVVGIKE